MHVRSANGTDKLQGPRIFRWEHTTVTAPREGTLSNWPYGHPDTIQTPAFEGSHWVSFGHDVRVETILKINYPIRGGVPE
jgi:hypothetical protein